MKWKFGRAKKRFARAIVTKLLTYALGRSLELADRETVDPLTKEFAEKNIGSAI